MVLVVFMLGAEQLLPFGFAFRNLAKPEQGGVRELCLLLDLWRWGDIWFSIGIAGNIDVPSGRRISLCQFDGTRDGVIIG